ncbi:hypothetical protein DCAR_0417432 [Daucus carota subsp. sativus]|uniref:Receptor-like serine/threonine-protein kinase n=1 Tax=Daucus carota subsp. sativus TaxID=79200 RepID=A0A162AD34_DAUCS|nr:PREDICTED: G-type lectin S-receptor-like serine/threonine-protein kinase SD3-1 [Daucus carota subsp. sativus]XP_017248544.1 PREDICTED: G-type lectin S-receptor-like serine/threonine-protein kinase SD3-1 [Daucus carota subsp. sativus]WOG98091.1 hypothetical protein DCAR_0417432 [Daucus carota subsp. sativus]
MILRGRPFFLLWICLGLGFLFSRVAVSQIQLGSRISVGENNYWVSSNGDFTVKFYNRSNGHSAGIHFNSLSVPPSGQTVVWIAGGDLTVGEGSYFELTKKGELVLFDSLVGAIAWTSQSANSSVTSAVLRDNGNLVLLNRQNDIVWQSFDTPSDTLLPGQNLSSSQTLRAASGNSVSSYYSLRLNKLGQLQLKWESDIVYWTSGSHSESFLRAVLSPDGALQLLDQNSKSVWSVYGDDHNESDVKYRILRLDVDGNLRLYSWIEAARSWRSGWHAVSDQCNVFATCGLNGLCLYNSSGSAVCKCPFTLTSDVNAKCLVPYQHNCRSGSSMFAYNHTFLYGVYPPNETIVHSSLLQCKNLCQENPLCTASTFTNDGSGQCRLKQTRYISGYLDDSVSSTSFVKRCSDPLAVLPVSPKPPPPSAKNSQQKQSHKFCIPCLIGATGGTIGTFLIFQIGVAIWFYFIRNSFRPKAASAYSGPLPKSFSMFPYLEIREIAEDFKHQVGPMTFKGMLHNKLPVVVIALNATLEERKFRSAALVLGSIHHKNLVKLEGYCCESGHRYMVYEFSKTKTLLKCLEDPKMCTRLTWRKRMNICISVAKTISYLHSGCREFVSHGNLNCETVLLDDCLEVKVIEYGLGCLEASIDGGCAEMDVRDFGKIVLTLIGGLEHQDSVECTYKHWSESQFDRIVDKRMGSGVDTDELERSLRLTFWCLQVDERMRPSMGEVLNVLESALGVDSPPPPFAARTPQPKELEEPSESNSAA